MERCPPLASPRILGHPAPLRINEAGDSPQRVSDDGARADRVSLQVNTPSARRLHFWRLPDGHIELSKVGVHDDLSI